jgi:putative salt-induced outer membrane protein YdiY
MKMMKKCSRPAKAALATACALILSSRLAPAQQLFAPIATNLWETSAAAAAALTRGNSENFLVTLTLDTKRKFESDEVSAGISAGFGESTQNNAYTKNTQFVQGYGQWNHLFTPRFYAGLRLDGQYDGIAGIDYRFKITPMAGYYFIKTDKMSLSAEVGPSLVCEHLSGKAPYQYAAIRFAENFEYKLSATTKFWETLAYIPQIDRWSENYLLNFETGIDTAINKHFSLRVVFQDMYASEPAPGKKNNDLRLLAGAAYKF